MIQTDETIALLASGDLGLHCAKKLVQLESLSCILTDRNSIGIQKLAASEGVPLYVGNPRGGKALESLAGLPRPGILLSVNYLFLVEQDLIDWPLYHALNIHGSLLPRYRGRTPHIWAIINGESMTGISAHSLTIGCDEGDIWLQDRIRIRPHHTGGRILQIFRHRYPRLIQKLILGLREGDLIPAQQNHDKATSFEKRTPEDGRIQWSWHRERIRNWIRALCKPYPGAFTFCGDTRIVIHGSRFSDLGFSQRQPDGTILAGGPEPVIKTPNGALQLQDLEMDEPVEFELNQVLQ